MGLAVSGLVSDGHEILTSLRRSAVDTNFVFNRDAKVSELVETMSKSLQACTQHSSRRPYGAGVLLAGLDDNKAQLYQLLPTGEIHECQAVGIGSRSQASRTYLEKHLDELDGAHMEKVRIDVIFIDVILHANSGLFSYFASAEGGVSKWRSRCFVLHSGHCHTRWF